MILPNKRMLKAVLGELPFTAELYWKYRMGRRPLNKSFALRKLEKRIPEWRAQAEAAARSAAPGKRLVLFGTLRYWVEQETLLGLALGGLGHTVTLAYLPYANWRKPINRFDLRRQNAYVGSILQGAGPLLQPVSLLDVQPVLDSLPECLEHAVQELSVRDVQYTQQVEEVDLSSPLYRLRLERNGYAARAALSWIQANKGLGMPDGFIIPNGSILEFGAVYAVARYLGIPVVTYEFGEQRNRIWLALNAEVMQQDTRRLWEAFEGQPLSEDEWQQVQTLFAARQRADLWQNFTRRWQGLPAQGGDQVRTDLGLDGRPVILLAANVIGDSLTLGRQVFSRSMTEWLERAVQYFAARPEVQLVVRIHPGERFTKGPSVAEVVRQALPDLPEHIHLVGAEDPVNTYDLIEIASLGMVYTTTTGMEMAMSGVPVLVAGQTHYRGKGFTLDPQSWEKYFALIEQALADLGAPEAGRLSRAQMELAWTYAYRFFFNYPDPFPWHLLHYEKALEEWPLERVLSAEGQAEFGAAFRYLAGESHPWERSDFVREKLHVD